MRLLCALTLALTFAACNSDPENCSEASCDGASEYCVLFGSDIAGEPDVATCEPLPAACDSDNTCGCVEANDTEGSLSFCFDLGGCDDSGAAVEIVCPGG